MFLPDDGSSTPINTTHITWDGNKHIHNEMPLTFGGGEGKKAIKEKGKN